MIYRPITLLRRLIQIFCFCLIIFGGFLGIKKQNFIFLPHVQKLSEFRWIEEESATVIRGPGYPQAFDTYLPIKSCRFARQTGTFRACFIHFISESISWLTPISIILPHILFFLVLAVLFGRMWCGWACPLGFIQDILNIIRKNLFINFYTLSEKIKKILKVVSYCLIVIIIILSIIPAVATLPWSLKKQVYLSVCQLCPSRFIFPYLCGWPIRITFCPIGYGIFTTIAIVFFLFFSLSFFIMRTWCRICPSGLLLSLFNRGALLSKEKDQLRCTHCGVCLRVCPLQNKKLYLEKKDKNVNYANCIRCFGCVDTCPETDCLKVKFLGLKIFSSKFKTSM